MGAAIGGRCNCFAKEEGEVEARISPCRGEDEGNLKPSSFLMTSEDIQNGAVKMADGHANALLQCQALPVAAEEAPTRAPTPDPSIEAEPLVTEDPIPAACQTEAKVEEVLRPTDEVISRKMAPVEGHTVSNDVRPKTPPIEKRQPSKDVQPKSPPLEKRVASKDAGKRAASKDALSKATPVEKRGASKEMLSRGSKERPAAKASALPAGTAAAPSGKACVAMPDCKGKPAEKEAAKAPAKAKAAAVAAAATHNALSAAKPLGVEIVQDRLWWIESQDCTETDKIFTPKVNMNGREEETWICFLNEKRVRLCRFSVPHYNMSMYHDDGPPALDQVAEACRILDQALSKNGRVVVYCPSGEEFEPRRRFSALFIAAYQVLVRGVSPLSVSMQWESDVVRPSVDFPAYSWASKKKPAPPRHLGLEDCLEALEFAKNKGWLDILEFDTTYFKELFLRWDASWMVPGELMLIADPVSTIDDPDPCTSRCLTPDKVKAEGDKQHAFTTFFKASGVGFLVRTNMDNEPGLRMSYKAKDLVPYGIGHLDVPVVDTHGGVPAIAVLKNVVEATDNFLTGGGQAIAIHCKAGFGRSAICALTLLIRRHGMPGRQAMAWCRLCRPGCINTMEQVEFLRKLRSKKDVESILVAESGSKSRRSFLFG